MSLIILILTLLGMIFEDKIGIKLCVIGCVGALALIITGVISEKNALKSIDLKTIFLFGGTLSLAAALQETGAGEEIATAVIGILGKNPSPYVLTFVVFMLCCVLTNFMSNTATTALLVPICVSIATEIGADPSAVLMACVIGGSCAYTYRYACQHNGHYSRRIHLQGLCKGRYSAYSSGDHCKYGLTADFLSVLPIRTDGSG